MLSTLECYFVFKVTKLDRDPASGTALQEISFWLNLERALYRIQEKRESPEVLLTLDILKHGKRFHATVSFDTDTGKDSSLELRGWCSELSTWVLWWKVMMHCLSWLLTPLHLISSFPSSRRWKWSFHLPPFPFRAFEMVSQFLGLSVGSPGGSLRCPSYLFPWTGCDSFTCKVTHAFDSPGRNRVYVKQKFFAHRAAEGKESWSVLSLLLFTCPSSHSLPSSPFQTVVTIKVVSEWAAGRVTLNDRVSGTQMWSARRGQTLLFTRDTLEPVIGTVVVMFFSCPSEKVVSTF